MPIGKKKVTQDPSLTKNIGAEEMRHAVQEESMERAREKKERNICQFSLRVRKGLFSLFSHQSLPF